MFEHHFEGYMHLDALPAEAFSYLDDPRQLSSHMAERSWRLAGTRMRVELDAGAGRVVGSHARLTGRVLGARLSVETVIIERVVPVRKVWQTCGVPRLLVIGAYCMGFELAGEADGSMLRVFIDYAWPRSSIGAVRGRLFGPRYARWCVQQMLIDARRALSARQRAVRPDGRA